MPNAIESERLLLVEGNDHRNFFEAFRDHLAIPEMQIENYGGVSQLSGVLAAYASSQDPMVGVLVLPDDGPGMLETVLARCPPPRS